MASQPSPTQPPAPGAEPGLAWETPAGFDPLVATASDESRAFVRDVVRRIAKTLDVAYAFAAEFAGSPTRVRTIGFWGRDAWLDDVEYDLAGTPCEDVAGGAVCHHRDGVQARFPRDRPLVEMGVRGYVGVPLVGADGRVLGHLAVMDTKPIEGDAATVTVFRLFAERIRIELERVRAERTLDHAGRTLAVKLAETEGELRMARGQLSALLRIDRAVAGHLQRRTLFAAVAEALRGVLPAERVILFVPTDDPTTLDVYAAYGDTGVEFFEGERIPRDTTAAGWVAEHRRPLVARSVEEIRERFPVSYERTRREGMTTLVIVPLQTNDRCVGVLTMMSKQAAPWDAVPPALLDEMAASVAVALGNCRAYEEVERLGRELRALLDVNVAVGRHLTRDGLFRAIAACLRDVVPNDRFGIELRVDDAHLQAHVLSSLAHGDAMNVQTLPAAGTACRWVEQHRRWLVAGTAEELRARFPVTFDVMRGERMESLCAVPLTAGDRSLGVLFFMAAARGAYARLRLPLVEQVASAVAVALDNCLAHEEVERLRDRLAAENVYLQEEIRQEHDFREIVGQSKAMLEMLAHVGTVAPTDATVLVLGETGTGKELVARAIHDRSPRRDRPLVKVNCSALSAGLVESELFGHVKGAFTGALTDRVGRFALADGGTIFLDEIGELAPETQVKLLRVLQEREFEPVGSTTTRKVDTRVIAATSRDLERAVADGTFRADLYYRLNVFPLRVPPLRERDGDVPLLVHHCVARFARELGRRIDGVARDTMERLCAYDWPGNVRELQNLIERAVVLTSAGTLRIAPELLPAAAPASRVPPPASRAVEPAAIVPLDAAQRRHIEIALDRAGWVIEGPRGAAAALDLHPNTLRSRMKKLGIRRPTPARA